MDVLSQPLVLPSNNQRRALTARSPMFLHATPIAVSNKIKAIQARKTRITLIPSDAVYTDMRSLNFTHNGAGGMISSRTQFAVLTTDRLVNRSRDTRLDRISPRQLSRPSVIVNTNNNQQSLLWSSYPTSARCNKQQQRQSSPTTHIPPGLDLPRAKSPNRKMPDIPRRQNRQEQQPNYPVLLDSKDKTKSNVQPSQNLRIKSHNVTINNNYLQTSESDGIVEDIFIDKEFEEYLEKAIVKCADWLIKYVFI